MGPKIFHVVLYEYFRVFLALTILHSKKWKNIYGSKVVLSEEPSKNNNNNKKNSSKKWNTEPKVVPKMWFRTIFGSIKNFFGLIFRTFSRGSKKEFFIKTSEMVQGNLKSQKGSLLNQNIHGYPEQGIAMHYNI